MESCDGWSLFKKSKFNQQPVRRYNALVMENFTRNRITICAYLTNLYNSFITSQYYSQNGNFKIESAVNNYFDLEKWSAVYEQSSPDKERSKTVGKP